MTDAARRPPDARVSFWPTLLATFGQYVRHPFLLWVGFIVVHFLLGMLALTSSSNPAGDVQLFYKSWVEQGFSGGQWVGIETVWVYPIVALVPMVIAYAFGPGLYLSTWLGLVMLVDAGAFAVLIGIGRDRRRAAPAWWWLAFLVLLGPIAVGRIDSIAVPVAIAGILLLASKPRLATVLLTLAAWIKVWPAALVGAAVIALRTRITVLWTAIVTSAIIVVTGLALGAGTNLFSFITQLTGRGIEIEAPMATFWMWNAEVGGPSRVFYDSRILAFEITGPGISVVGTIVTVLLALVVLALFGLAIVLMRRGVSSARLLPPLALALTTAFLVFNKVGSPQYATWLAVPLALGLVSTATGLIPSSRVPALLALAVAGLTQLGYPTLFDALLRLEYVAVLVLTARNILYVVLFAWAVRELIVLANRALAVDLDDTSLSAQEVWPFERLP